MVGVIVIGLVLVRIQFRTLPRRAILQFNTPSPTLDLLSFRTAEYPPALPRTNRRGLKVTVDDEIASFVQVATRPLSASARFQVWRKRLPGWR